MDFSMLSTTTVVMLALGVVAGLFILWSLLGIVVISESEVGLVIKKFALRSLPDGRILATRGEAGCQADTLAPGIHFFKFWFQYKIEKRPLTSVPKEKIGVVIANDGSPLPVGHILGKGVECNNFQDAKQFLENGGQKGAQLKILTAGMYRINPWLFDIKMEDIVEIESGKVGVVTTCEGAPLSKNEIAGEVIDGHNNFQDPEVFLANEGKKGLQQQVILAGVYFINPLFADVRVIPMTDVPIGNVGVVVSYTGKEGKDLTGDAFQHGNIVEVGCRGVWNKPFDPGRYPLNNLLMQVESVPTTNIVLNWADSRNESHGLDQNLSTIAVISKDGFKFSVDVSQIIHIPSKDAPQVVGRFGNMRNLVSQVLEPMIANYFRNSAQTREVLEFISDRKDIQEEAKEYITTVLREYNVIGVDTLIGDIVPPAEIMQTLMDKQIAEKQQATFTTQKQTQIVKQELEKQTAIAEMQAEIVQAERGVVIAEQQAQAEIKRAEGEAKAVSLRAGAEAGRVEIVGKAEAVKIEAIGAANAAAYESQVKAMGANNFALTKVIDTLAANNTRLMPDTLIVGGTGSGDGANGLQSLISMQVLDAVNKLNSPSEQTK